MRPASLWGQGRSWVPRSLWVQGRPWVPRSLWGQGRSWVPRSLVDRPCMQPSCCRSRRRSPPCCMRACGGAGRSREDAMRLLSIIIVGGGPTGVEVAGAGPEQAPPQMLRLPCTLYCSRRPPCRALIGIAAAGELANLINRDLHKVYPDRARAITCVRALGRPSLRASGGALPLGRAMAVHFPWAVPWRCTSPGPCHGGALPLGRAMAVHFPWAVPWRCTSPGPCPARALATAALPGGWPLAQAPSSSLWGDRCAAGRLALCAGSQLLPAG